MVETELLWNNAAGWRIYLDATTNKVFAMYAGTGAGYDRHRRVVQKWATIPVDRLPAPVRAAYDKVLSGSRHYGGKWVPRKNGRMRVSSLRRNARGQFMKARKRSKTSKTAKRPLSHVARAERAYRKGLEDGVGRDQLEQLRDRLHAAERLKARPRTNPQYGHIGIRRGAKIRLSGGKELTYVGLKVGGSFDGMHQFGNESRQESIPMYLSTENAKDALRRGVFVVLDSKAKTRKNSYSTSGSSTKRRNGAKKYTATIRSREGRVIQTSSGWSDELAASEWGRLTIEGWGRKGDYMVSVKPQRTSSKATRKNGTRSMASIKAANKAAGLHWFEPASMRFFKSRIEAGPWANGRFVTSEQGPDERRRYSVRQAKPDGGIETVGAFQAYSTKAAAVAAAQGKVRASYDADADYEIESRQRRNGRR